VRIRREYKRKLKRKAGGQYSVRSMGGTSGETIGGDISPVHGKLSMLGLVANPVKLKTIGDFFGENRLAAPGGISSTKRVCKVVRQ
jgi:hypothetical protein